VTLVVFILAGIVACILLRRRSRRALFYASHEPAREIAFAEAGNGELPASNLDNVYSSTGKSLGSMPGPLTPRVGDSLHQLQMQGSDYGHAEMESNGDIARPGHQTYLDPTGASSLAELGSVKSDSAIRRKPV
jgi:hypothetical protein